MKKNAILFFIILFPLCVFADAVQVNGIYYNFDESTKTASVTYRGTYTYSYDEYVGDIVIPASVTYKGTTYSVTTISTGAFDGCKSLTSIVIPESVTKLEERPFCYSSLKSISLPYTLKDLGRAAFYQCASLISITIPEGITSIKDDMFYGCSSLASVKLPNSITMIEDGAFNNCSSLSSITIPSKVTTIEIMAFNNCSALKSITINALNPPTISSGTISSNPICYVPCGRLDAYANSNWKEYCYQFIEQSSLYEVLVESNNNSSGVAKLVSYPDCTSAIVTAIPNEGCIFVKWSDGNTQTTRYLELTKDINLTAYFAKQGYTIHVYQDCNTNIE